MVSGRKTRRPGEIAIPPGSGLGKRHTCTCWPQPDNPLPCTPQTCDWRCRACRIYGQSFYSREDLQYLEHGTGPLAPKLARLGQAKGTLRGGTARERAGDEIDGSPASPSGAAGRASRRLHSLAVTDLYYAGLQDPPPGQDGRSTGSGQ
jgi:hypothetical protein